MQYNAHSTVNRPKHSTSIILPLFTDVFTSNEQSAEICNLKIKQDACKAFTRAKGGSPAFLLVFAKLK